MDHRRTLLDYLGMLMTLFGVCVLILGILTVAVGDEARAVSSMFALGSAGIPIPVLFQYLVLLAIICSLRLVFFSDRIMRHMSTGPRVLCMGASCVGLTAIFVAAFGWFPTDMWQPWAMMLVCFGVCFASAAAITRLKEKSDTRRLQDALRRLKNREDKQDDTDN